MFVYRKQLMTHMNTTPYPASSFRGGGSQTERQTEKQRWTDRHKYRQTDRQPGSQAGRDTDRDTDRRGSLVVQSY